MDYQSLKTRHHNERNAHHPNLALRVHRALSWLTPGYVANRARTDKRVDHDAIRRTSAVR